MDTSLHITSSNSSQEQKAPLSRILITGGSGFIGINLIKSPSIPNYPTTNFLELTNIKINRNKAILKLKKIFSFIIIFSQRLTQVIKGISI
jgi:dTDP-D-glucose 4,6-dehydratase